MSSSASVSRKGSLRHVDISGLNAVQAMTTPGPMAKGNGTLAVYRRQPRQRGAARRTRSDLHRRRRRSAVTLRPDDLDQTADQDPRKSSSSPTAKPGSFRFPGSPTLRSKVSPVSATRTYGSTTSGIRFRSRLAAAKATSSHYKDHSLNFDNSGRNGHFSAIHWSNS